MEVNVQCYITYCFVMQIIDAMTFVIFQFPACFASLTDYIYKIDLILFIYLFITCSWFMWNGNCKTMGGFLGHCMQGHGNKGIALIDLLSSSLLSWIQVLKKWYIDTDIWALIHKLQLLWNIRFLVFRSSVLIWASGLCKQLEVHFCQLKI